MINLHDCCGLTLFFLLGWFQWPICTPIRFAESFDDGRMPHADSN